MNLAALNDNQAEDLGLEDDAKHEYVAAKVTKSNYAPAGETVYLHRGDGGVLTYHEPQEVHSAAYVNRIKMVVELVKQSAAAGRTYSKTSFAKCHAGKNGLFKMGINKVERLINKTIAEGFLTQGPAPARSLQLTGKPTEIAKAKLPAIVMEARNAAHGPEKVHKSET